MAKPCLAGPNTEGLAEQPGGAAWVGGWAGGYLAASSLQARLAGSEVCPQEAGISPSCPQGTVWPPFLMGGQRRRDTRGREVQQTLKHVERCFPGQAAL